MCSTLCFQTATTCQVFRTISNAPPITPYSAFYVPCGPSPCAYVRTHVRMCTNKPHDHANTPTRPTRQPPNTNHYYGKQPTCCNLFLPSLPRATMMYDVCMYVCMCVCCVHVVMLYVMYVLQCAGDVAFRRHPSVRLSASASIRPRTRVRVPRVHACTPNALSQGLSCRVTQGANTQCKYTVQIQIHFKRLLSHFFTFFCVR